MSISIKNISKSFGSFQALQDINLDIPTGELVALLGPSGSGKTSLLRIIAGLEETNSGRILFDEQDMTWKNATERQVGFVFQHYALFRHMNVFENAAFGLKVRPSKTRPAKSAIEKRVMELLELVKMDKMVNRFPSQLSGGQRQRVALARALAVEPKVLLLDEPFGALDAKVRKELRRWLRKLHDDFPVTSVFVTHDQEEALDVADRIVVMNEGKIEQIGSPEEVYDHPANPFVYHFLGNVNLFHGRIHKGQLNTGNIQINVGDHTQAEDLQATGFVRPHNISVSHSRDDDEALAVKVVHVHIVGPLAHLELKRTDSGELIEAELTKERYEQLGIKEGHDAFVSLKDLKVFIEDYSI